MCTILKPFNLQIAGEDIFVYKVIRRSVDNIFKHRSDRYWCTEYIQDRLFMINTDESFHTVQPKFNTPRPNFGHVYGPGFIHSFVTAQEAKDCTAMRVKYTKAQVALLGSRDIHFALIKCKIPKGTLYQQGFQAEVEDSITGKTHLLLGREVPQVVSRELVYIIETLEELPELTLHNFI